MTLWRAQRTLGSVLGDKVSLRWVVVSYFITGGLLAGAQAHVVTFDTPLVPDTWIYGLAAAIAGFAAGRTSHARTVLEPTIAAALVVASLCGVNALFPGTCAFVSGRAGRAVRVGGDDLAV